MWVTFLRQSTQTTKRTAFCSHLVRASYSMNWRLSRRGGTRAAVIGLTVLVCAAFLVLVTSRSAWAAVPRHSTVHRTLKCALSDAGQQCSELDGSTWVPPAQAVLPLPSVPSSTVALIYTASAPSFCLYGLHFDRPPPLDR